MSQRNGDDPKFGKVATAAEQVPPWERTIEWYRARVEELERDVAHHSSRERLATKALADALAMPAPGLRDYLAGQALAAHIAAGAPCEGTAVNSYRYADAMMAERHKSARLAVLAGELAAAMVHRHELSPDAIAGAEEWEGAIERVRLAFEAVLEEHRRG